MRDFYQVLGVARTATSTELRSAYVRMAKRHHPDLSDPAKILPRRLQEIQQAYRCLSDTGLRAEHDSALSAHGQRHLVHQHRVHRRLRSYDRRHPRRAPRSGSNQNWRRILIVASAALFATMAYLR